MTRKVFSLLATLALIHSAQATTLTPRLDNKSSQSTTPTLSLAAEEDEEEGLFWWGAGANITSNYLWRGYDQPYSGNMFDPAIQPSVTLGLGAFYVDLWYNFSTMSKYQELDMTLGFDYNDHPLRRVVRLR